MPEKKLRRLPLGIADFKKIVDGDYVYVDKTELIYRLITGGEYYFLSRPRRFGKSLLISTLAEIFAGNKELFKELWIGTSDYTWSQHPVIRLDFSSIGHRTLSDLMSNIDVRLDDIARDYAIDVSRYPSIDSKFQELIVQLSKTNKVVILIDEYDKPILDHIDNPHEAAAQREVLKSLYSVIKGADQYLRFVFLTGVSKFAKTSVFSGINNLTDISLDVRYATLLGYTNHELLNYFSPYLERLAKTGKKSFQEMVHEVTNYYDGYQFTENAERMFNPYSVMRCFDAQKFENYWFATGTPTFLIKLLQNSHYDLESVTCPVLNEEDLGSFELEAIPLSSLLFQTGYLTIKDHDAKTNNYTLGIPNKEVYNGFTRQLVNVFTLLPANKSIQYARLMMHAFVHGDMVDLQQKLQEFFNRMPYTVHVKDEAGLQFVLYSIFALIGVAVDPEVTTSLGRADLVVSLPKLVYVIELKFNKTAQDALAQIQDKKYYEKYLNTGKQITLLGINFDHKTKEVSVVSCDQVKTKDLVFDRDEANKR